MNTSPNLQLPPIGNALAEARHIFIVMNILRVPIVISVAIMALLSLPDQSLEVYRAVAQEFSNKTVHDWDKWREVTFSLISIFCISLTLWFVSRQLTLLFYERVTQDARKATHLLHWGPHYLALAPYIGIAVGLLMARGPDISSTIEPELRKSMIRAIGNLPESVLERIGGSILNRIFSFNDTLLWTAVGVILLGLGVLAVVAAFSKFRRLKISHESSWLLHWSTYLLSYSVIAGTIIIISFIPVALPREVGTFGVLGAFFVSLTLTLGRLSYWSDKYGIPLILGLFLAAILFSGLDINDNHKLREIDAKDASHSTDDLSALQEQFQQWLEERPDRKLYEERELPYPVYVVAAQGGGIYAAFHTASFLGSLQDQCPSFAQHLFAVSGVSGGSVGAAFFSSLVNTAKFDRAEVGCTRAIPTKFSYVEVAERFFKKDFLSPLFGGLFFPDFLQRFLFFPVPPFDRARALEYSVEDAWDAVMKELLREYPDLFSNNITNPFRNAYLNHWNPKSSGPALLLNTTDVSSGQRRIIAPFRLIIRKEQQRPDFPASVTRTLPLSTAVVLSARFPWVTPAGWFYELTKESPDGPEERKKVRLVDGGYFENSGAATALDLMREIKAVAKDSSVSINLIVLTSGGFPTKTSYRFDEGASPIRALLNTGSSRGYITIEQATRELAIANPDALPVSPEKDVRMHNVTLKGMGYPLPLGWRLSMVTRLLILAQNGDRTKCVPDKVFKQSDKQRFAADCIRELVFRELNLQ